MQVRRCLGHFRVIRLAVCRCFSARSMLSFATASRWMLFGSLSVRWPHAANPAFGISSNSTVLRCWAPNSRAALMPKPVHCVCCTSGTPGYRHVPLMLLASVPTRAPRLSPACSSNPGLYPALSGGLRTSPTLLLTRAFFAACRPTLSSPRWSGAVCRIPLVCFPWLEPAYLGPILAP